MQHNLPHVSFPEFVRQLIANLAGAGATAVVLRVKHDVQVDSTVMDYQDNGMAMPYETHVQVGDPAAYLGVQCNAVLLRTNTLT